MNLQIMMVFTLLTSCTLQKSETATEHTGPKSCYDYTSLDACDRDEKCRSEFGADASTAEDVFMACMPAYPTHPGCSGQKACYTSSTGQRALASQCDYPRWTEVACTSEELDPCKYTTAAACEADKRCQLNRAKDLSTSESIAMGCGYIKGFCDDSLICYTNKINRARVLASSLCDTPFPEWESTDCTQADYQAAYPR